MTEQAECITTRCCIAGGGPAGMMLGFLLARAGIETVVLEKHADFLRDFRGDTIHPSTLEVMNDLGLYDAFLSLPHQEARTLSGQMGDVILPMADFSHMPTRAKFIAIMPQWDFLNFLAREGQKYPTFHLHMLAEVNGLIEEGGVVRGVTAQTPQGPLEIRADLVVGADGRHSTVRAKADLPSVTIGAPMDVLWFRLSRRQSDPDEALGHLEPGRMLVLINRGEHWQCGFVIPKGTAGEMKQQDVDVLRRSIISLVPSIADRTAEIKSWDDVKLLTVTVDRLTRWHRPGLLCIGDSAHAMSPVGGVGINLAIQDAVATANILTPALKAAAPIPETELARVQARREFPVKATQALQVFIQNRVVSRVLASRGTKLSPPWFFRLLILFPWLRQFPARAIGLGVRPERVQQRK